MTPEAKPQFKFVYSKPRPRIEWSLDTECWLISNSGLIVRGVTLRWVEDCWERTLEVLIPEHSYSRRVAPEELFPTREEAVDYAREFFKHMSDFYRWRLGELGP